MAVWNLIPIDIGIHFTRKIWTLIPVCTAMNIHITIYTSNPIKRFDKVFFSLSVCIKRSNSPKCVFVLTFWTIFFLKKRIHFKRNRLQTSILITNKQKNRRNFHTKWHSRVRIDWQSAFRTNLERAAYSISISMTFPIRW